MKKNNLYLAILCIILLVIVVILAWIVVPLFVVNVIVSLVAAGIGYIVIFLLRQVQDSISVAPIKHLGLQVWDDRDKVSPSFNKRITLASKSIFFVGFTFETTFKDYGKFLKDALMTHSNLEVKLLMIHPNSLHVSAHQYFTDRDLKRHINEGINSRLKSLCDELNPSAQERLNVRATYYLPRFAARIFDDEVMLLNFYLLKAKAHVNPVIEIRRDKHEQVFNRIFSSLNEMFKIGDDGKATHSNYHIIENGNWHGLPTQQ